MTPNMERGARIIIHEWVRVKAWDIKGASGGGESAGNAGAEKSAVRQHTDC